MLNRQVLLLNQNFEPFAVCSAQRAMILLFLQKVQLVEMYDESIHSVSATFPYPSVIRLQRYVHKPFKKIILNRKNIIRRDSNRCQYCGKNSQPMTVDHIIPKSLGGGDSWENLICACLRCNAKKGSRTPEQAGLQLLKKPKKPSHLLFLHSMIGKPHQSWKPYLFLH